MSDRSWKKFGTVLAVFSVYITVLLWIATTADPIVVFYTFSIVMIVGIVGAVVIFAWLVSSPSIINKDGS